MSIIRSLSYTPCFYSFTSFFCLCFSDLPSDLPLIVSCLGRVPFKLWDLALESKTKIVTIVGMKGRYLQLSGVKKEKKKKRDFYICMLGIDLRREQLFWAVLAFIQF